MKRRRLGFDFDDVMFDFNGGLALFHNIHYGTSYGRSDIVSYHLRDLWKVSIEEQNRRIREFYLSREHAGIQPLPGAIRVMQMLEEDNDLFVITARPEDIRPQTMALIEAHFPSLVDRVYITNRFGQTGAEVRKSEVCQREGITGFVDDAPMHHEDVSRVVPKTLLFETPWNREYALKIPQNQQVRSWYGIGMLLG